MANLEIGDFLPAWFPWDIQFFYLHPPKGSRNQSEPSIYCQCPLKNEMQRVDILSAPLEKSPKGPNFVGFFEEKIQNPNPSLQKYAILRGRAAKNWNVPLMGHMVSLLLGSPKHQCRCLK